MRCSTAASTPIPRTYRKLGELTHRSAQAEVLARYADETMTTIKERVEKIPESRRPRVYYARGPRGLETGLGGSINVETIEFLGARNVAAERKGGLALVSVEQVLSWNPEVVVTIDRDFAANFRTASVWAEVAAVRAGRVHLSPKMPFGWVDFPPSVNRLIGLWWLAKILYPEQFEKHQNPFHHPLLPSLSYYRLLKVLYAQFYNLHISQCYVRLL